jgi:hypothetical protein
MSSGFEQNLRDYRAVHHHGEDRPKSDNSP